MNRSTRRVLLLGVVLTAALIVVATATGDARLGPLVFWALHETEDAEGSTVALRPGLGLLAVWAGVSGGIALSHCRRRDV
jgi:hypothetical protein